MPIKIKKANEPVECGVNKYVDVCFGTSHGNWHGTENAAKADKKAVEASAENEAWVAAQQEAVAVAERKCPQRRCPNKSSEDDPDPVKPWYRPAEIIESAPESELGKGWRWHAKARVEYQVLFSCD
jgi:hypothetical protein